MSRQSRDLKTILGAAHEWYIDGPIDNETAGWSDLTADLSAGKAVGVNAPTWATFRDGISAYSFSASTMNEMWVTFHVNHDAYVGSTFYPHIHWAANTTDTGVVRWGIEYTIAEGHNTANFPASTTIYLEDTVSSSAQYQHRIIECSDAQAITMPDVDSLLMFRIFRDAAHANDTFGGVAFGLTVDIHYRRNKFATKNKAPNFNE